MSSCTLIYATALQPGAIAILQLVGDCVPILEKLTGRQDWPIGKLRLVQFADIDQGLAGRISDDVAQLMPHGGPRVIQKLIARLLELEVQIDTDECDRVFPEADDRIESLMLRALARTHSPLAIDLLLDQPRRWRDAQEFDPTETDLARSNRLNRLIKPSTVVLAGLPNVGKSSLSNLLLGRSMSIALDMPGTTRDYTAGRIELAGLVVDWYDTPGLRSTFDPIESQAVEIARNLIDQADLLISMRDPDTDWPELTRAADLRVFNKLDLLDNNAHVSVKDTGDILHISARTGEGIQSLVTHVRNRLVSPADINDPAPWSFDDKMLTRCES